MIIYFIFEKIVNTILVMKKIVGLDLGTNSIGWALINAYIDEYNKEHLYGIEAWWQSYYTYGRSHFRKFR